MRMDFRDGVDYDEDWEAINQMLDAIDDLDDELLELSLEDTVPYHIRVEE